MIVRYRIEIPEAQLADICRHYHVRELNLHGSVLRDDFRDDSDIDVLVEYERGAMIGFIEHLGLQEELAALLERDVDLVSKRGMNPLIRDEVLDSSQLLYAA